MTGKNQVVTSQPTFTLKMAAKQVSKLYNNYGTLNFNLSFYQTEIVTVYK